MKGKPVALALGTTVSEVVIVTAGSGQTPGNYTATASSGTATIAYTIGAAGTLSSVSVTNAGSYPTGTVPTFTIAAGGTPATVATHMNVDVNNVTSWDASAVSTGSDARGVFLASVTASQITAGAWIVIQELGIAEVLITTASGTPAAGQQAVVTNGNGGNVTTNSTFTASAAAILGKTVDIPATATLTRVDLSLPVRQG